MKIHFFNKWKTQGKSKSNFKKQLQRISLSSISILIDNQSSCAGTLFALDKTKLPIQQTLLATLLQDSIEKKVIWTNMRSEVLKIKPFSNAGALVVETVNKRVASQPSTILSNCVCQLVSWREPFTSFHIFYFTNILLLLH